MRSFFRGYRGVLAASLGLLLLIAVLLGTREQPKLSAEGQPEQPRTPVHRPQHARPALAGGPTTFGPSTVISHVDSSSIAAVWSAMPPELVANMTSQCLATGT